MDDRFDLLILGSGSTAFAAAIRAADLGARVAMTERRILGGTCVNRGCLPSKNLIEAARMVHEAAHPRYAGLTAASIGVDFAALVAQKDEVVHEYRARKYASVADGLSELRVLEGDAAFVNAHSVRVAGQEVVADRILIATGSRPAVPPIPGLDSVPYLTSDLLDADESGRLTTLPESLAILGGGYIAVELAQMFSRLGSQVSLVARSGLLSGYEPELGHALAEVFLGEGIDVRTEAHVRRISSHGQGVELHLEQAGTPQTVTAQRLIIATGRTPETDSLRVERAGVELDEGGFVGVDAQLRTSQPHIWAAGDVIGRQHRSQMATPVGARQGRIVADNAFAGAGESFDGSLIPRAIFTDPAIAVVGETEAEVRARHLPAVTATTPLRYVPRAGAVHRPGGLVKFVVSSTDERVLGVHVIGESAPEIIHEAAMAMKFGADLDDFVELIHIYPTMSEALKIGAQAFRRDVSRLSCCAE